MKYIEKLLNGAEVKWMPLGEVFETRNGYTPSKANNDFWTNGDIPWFRMEDIRDSGRLLNDSIQHITPQAIKGKGLFRANSIIMATTATIGEHALLLVDALANQQFTNFQIRKSLSERISPMFAFYYFFVLGEWCKSNVNTSSFPSVDMARLMKQLFPIPPLAVQEEIVRILDKFTTLEAELEAELDCRKRQYEYYRNQLLSFDVLDGETQSPQNVTWLTIEDISNNISSGGTPRSNIAAYYGGNIPWLRTQEVNFSEIWDTEIKITEEGMNSSSAKYIPANCVIVAMYGATVGRVGINKIPLTTNQACANIEVDDSIAFYKYVYYYLSSQYKYIKSLGTGSQTNINAGIVRKLKIPIPPLAEQQRIVSILDKFEALTTSISEGLPKEIALRRMQYEYYRNQLLSFA